MSNNNEKETVQVKLTQPATPPSFLEGCASAAKSGVQIGCWVGGIVLVVGLAGAIVSAVTPSNK